TMDMGFNVNEDGKVKVEQPVSSQAPLADVTPLTLPVELQDVMQPGAVVEHESKLPLILEKINDPNYPLAEVNRLIAIEIALITREMGSLRSRAFHNDFTEAFLQKSYADNIKALQALEKSLTSTDILNNRDILNVDGPKFQFAFAQAVDWFKLACQQALGRDNETMVQSIMKHFRDIAAMGEAELRSDIEKVDR